MVNPISRDSNSQSFRAFAPSGFLDGDFPDAEIRPSPKEHFGWTGISLSGCIDLIRVDSGSQIEFGNPVGEKLCFVDEGAGRQTGVRRMRERQKDCVSMEKGCVKTIRYTQTMSFRSAVFWRREILNDSVFTITGCFKISLSAPRH